MWPGAIRRDRGAERQAAWLQRVVLQCGPARFAGISQEIGKKGTPSFLASMRPGATRRDYSASGADPQLEDKTSMRPGARHSPGSGRRPRHVTPPGKHASMWPSAYRRGSGRKRNDAFVPARLVAMLPWGRVARAWVNRSRRCGSSPRPHRRYRDRRQEDGARQRVAPVGRAGGLYAHFTTGPLARPRQFPPKPPIIAAHGVGRRGWRWIPLWRRGRGRRDGVATIVAIHSIIPRRWTSITTFGCAPDEFSCSGQSLTRAGRTRARWRRNCEQTRMIGWCGRV